jgi:hypothetical protein
LIDREIEREIFASASVGGRRDFSRFDPRPAGHAPSTLELCPLCPDMSGHCLDTVDLDAGSKPV